MRDHGSQQFVSIARMMVPANDRCGIAGLAVTLADVNGVAPSCSLAQKCRVQSRAAPEKRSLERWPSGSPRIGRGVSRRGCEYMISHLTFLALWSMHHTLSKHKELRSAAGRMHHEQHGPRIFFNGKRMFFCGCHLATGILSPVVWGISY